MVAKIALFLFVFSRLSFADTVYLKDGKTLENVEVKEKNDGLWVGGVLFEKSLIEKIEKAPISEPIADRTTSCDKSQKSNSSCDEAESVKKSWWENLTSGFKRTKKPVEIAEESKEVNLPKPSPDIDERIRKRLESEKYWNERKEREYRYRDYERREAERQRERDRQAEIERQLDPFGNKKSY